MRRQKNNAIPRPLRRFDMLPSLHINHLSGGFLQRS